MNEQIRAEAHTVYLSDGRIMKTGEMYTCRQIDAPWGWDRVGETVELVAIINAFCGVFSDGKEELIVLPFENVVE